MRHQNATSLAWRKKGLLFGVTSPDGCISGLLPPSNPNHFSGRGKLVAGSRCPAHAVGEMERRNDAMRLAPLEVDARCQKLGASWRS